MGFWQELSIQFGVVFVAASVAFLVVFVGVIRPFINRRIEALQRANEQREERFNESVRAGIEQTFQELPQSEPKESASSLRRIGSGLVENGLSTFLGKSAEPQGSRTRNGSEARDDIR